MSRPILPWRTPMEFNPWDSTPVWIRRLPFYDKPIRALWNGGDIGATVTANPAAPHYDAQIFVPAVNIHSWKFQFKSDQDEQMPIHDPP